MKHKLIIVLVIAAVITAVVVAVSFSSSATPPVPLVISDSPHPSVTVLPSSTPVPASASPTSSPSTPSPNPTAAPIPSDARLNSYPSPDNRFAVDVYDVGTESNQCPFRIKDRGREIDGTRLLGLATIDCWSAMFFDSAFQGWVDGDRFLIRKAGNDIMIVDIAQSSVRDYQINSGVLFRGASHTLKYWLFQKDPDGPYALFGEDRKAVAIDLSIVGNAEALYDAVNDGFLFINRDSTYKFNASTVSVRLDFLSLKNLSLRHMLTTEPTSARDMGCGSTNGVVSQTPGEVILYPGCLTVGSKYIASDGNIHLPLK